MSRFLFLILFFFNYCLSFSQVLATDYSKTNISSKTDILKKDFSSSFDSLMLLSEAWQPNTDDYINCLHSNTCWLKIVIDSPGREKRFLSFDNPLLQNIELYQFHQDTLVLKKTGTRIPPLLKELDVLYPSFILSLDKGANVFFVKINHIGSIFTRVFLLNESGFAQKNSEKLPHLWSIIGILSIIAIYCIYNVFFLKDIRYLYFAVFILFYIFYILLFNGLAFRTFFSLSSNIHISLLQIIGAIILFTFSLFSNRLLNLRKRFIILYKGSVFLVLIPSLIFIALSLITSLYVFVSYGLFVLFLVQLVLYLLAYSENIFKHRKGIAILALLSCFVYFVSRLFHPFFIMDILEMNNFTLLFPEYGFLLSIILFFITINQKSLNYSNIITQRNEELVKTNRELEIKKSRTDEINRLKTTFLANISHEIRTPMNGILGFANMLKTTELSHEEVQSYIEIIDTNAKKLLAVINQIIDISKIEAGYESIEEKSFCLIDFLDCIHREYEPLAKEKGIELVLKKHQESTLMIHTDQEKLHKIFSNLIDNAIKFTKIGYVEFGYLKPDKDEYFKFFIKDTGIGISSEDQQKIYEHFNQLDYTSTRTYSGMGLGLSIAKGYVNLLKGKLWLVSRLNEGSTFLFTIPFKRIL